MLWPSSELHNLQTRCVFYHYVSRKETALQSVKQTEKQFCVVPKGLSLWQCILKKKNYCLVLFFCFSMKGKIICFSVKHKGNNISWQYPTFSPFFLYIMLIFQKSGKAFEILYLWSIESTCYSPQQVKWSESLNVAAREVVLYSFVIYE